MTELLPNSFAKFIINQTKIRNLKIIELSKKEINNLTNYIHTHQVDYIKNEGYRKAEVMKGGVLTNELTKTLEARKYQNLYFIGETVDVTGLLGGFNFQWAWSSAYCCAQGIITKFKS